MKKTKVLHVGPLPPPTGGISAFIQNLKMYSDMDSKLEFFNIFPKKNRSLNKKIYNLFVLFKYFIYLFLKKPDLIHIHTAGYKAFTKSMMFLYISKVFNKKVILHVHSGRFMEFYGESTPFKKKMITKAFKDSDKIICLSHSWKDLFLKTFPLEESKYEVVPNGIFTKEFMSLSPSFSGQTKNILFVGKLVKNKGILDIIKMATQLKGHPEIKFKIMGDGPLKDSIKQKTEEQGLNIEILGSLSGKEKLEQFENAQIFFLPSYFEGLSLTVLEAMAAGLVVLTTRVGALPDVVTEPSSGYLFEPGDVNGFVNHISSLNNKEMSEISSYNKEEASKYDFYQLDKNLEALYKRMLS